MRRFTFLFLFLAIQTFANDFGFITSSTKNIGDDIQSIAARQFLPYSSISIDRDTICQFEWSSKVSSIVNGWFMHPKIHTGNSIQMSSYQWPPSNAIDPLLISIHFTNEFLPIALSRENIQYLIDHGPVGARDYFTLHALKRAGVPSYFSGCLTLTLSRSSPKKENIVYAVDLDEECIKFLKSKSPYPVEVVSHEISKTLANDPVGRAKLAEELLDKYQKARYVVTIRLHAAMPCLALETPVLLINTQPDQYRFSGLKELVRNCSRDEFLKGKSKFNFRSPTPNSKDYLPIRARLIETITSWVEEKTEENL